MARAITLEGSLNDDLWPEVILAMIGPISRIFAPPKLSKTTVAYSAQH